MKVCISWAGIRNISHNEAGDVTQLKELAKALSLKGQEVIFVTLNSGGIKYIDSVKIKQVPFYPYLRARLGQRWLPPKWSNPYQVVNYITNTLEPKERCDIFHFRSAEMIILFKGKLPDKPVVFTAAPDLSSTRKNQIHEQALIMSDKIIVLSELWKKYYLTNFNIPDKKIEILPPCVDTNKFHPEVIPDNLFDKDPVIGYFGTIRKNYGLDNLIKVVSLLKKEFPNIKLLIGGMPRKDRYDITLKQLIKEEKLEKHCLFLGLVSHQNLPQYLANCHVLVNLRKDPTGTLGFDYGIPIKVIEYAALAKPVLVSRDGGMEELLGNEYKLFVNPDDIEEIFTKLSLLLRDQDLNQSIGLYLNKIALKYSLQKIGKKAVQIYKAALK